jgi:hypothetical protein
LPIFLGFGSKPVLWPSYPGKRYGNNSQSFEKERLDTGKKEEPKSDIERGSEGIESKGGEQKA